MTVLPVGGFTLGHLTNKTKFAVTFGCACLVILSPGSNALQALCIQLHDGLASPSSLRSQAGHLRIES